MWLIIFLIVLLLGLVFWKLAEKKHYKSIVEREEKYKDIAVISDRDLRAIKSIKAIGQMQTGGTVVAIDSFKKLMAGFVNIFGWKMKSYESLLDRARREATLQVKEKAFNKWCNCLVNLRIETSSITKNAKQKIWSVEAMAYATIAKI